MDRLKKRIIIDKKIIYAIIHPIYQLSWKLIIDWGLGRLDSYNYLEIKSYFQKHFISIKDIKFYNKINLGFTNIKD